MSWNRQNTETPSQTKRTGLPIRRLLTCAAVVLLVAGIYCLFHGDGKPVLRQTAKVQSDKSIKVVKPSAAPQEVEEVVVKEPPRPQVAGEIRNNKLLLPNGRLYDVVGITTSHVMKVTLADHIFSNPSDHSIATLLTVEPGDGLLGESSSYYTDFTEHFKESLKTPIVINQDDDEDARTLKQAVIDARQELKQRMDAGEDLAEVMRESREQMRELGLYRDEICKQVKDILATKDELSDDDIEDLKGAANKMLEERGVKPLVFDSAFAYQIRMEAIEMENKENKQ